MFDHHRHGGLGIERHASGYHLVEQHSKRVDIALSRERIAAALFGRHVVGGADDAPGLREVFGASHHLGDAKIGEQAVAALVDQHVAGFYVPVDQALRVGIVERVPQL